MEVLFLKQIAQFHFDSFLLKVANDIVPPEIISENLEIIRTSRGQLEKILKDETDSWSVELSEQTKKFEEILNSMKKDK